MREPSEPSESERDDRHGITSTRGESSDMMPTDPLVWCRLLKVTREVPNLLFHRRYLKERERALITRSKWRKTSNINEGIGLYLGQHFWHASGSCPRFGL